MGRKLNSAMLFREARTSSLGSSYRPTRAILTIALQHLRRAVQRSREGRDLLLSASEVVPIDGLVNSGDDDSCVSGVLAGSVNGVPEPGTVRKSFGHQERPLRVAQCLIQFVCIARRVLLSDQHLRGGLLEMMG